MKHRKILASLLAVTIFAAACAPAPAPAAPTATAPTATATPDAPADPAPAGDEILVRMAFENPLTDPIGRSLLYWQENLNAMNVGLRAELFPDSQLGSKNEVIDSMLLGEAVITLADGTFYADYGVPDFGIYFGPFFFNDWDEVWRFHNSPWFAEQVAILQDRGITMLSHNWRFGARHLMTTSPVRTVEDLQGLRIRVPANRIQTLGFDAMGAAATGMPLGDVYQALQTGVVDGVENPLSVLYGRMFHEVTDYIILTGHVLNATTWVTSADWFDTLTSEQQNALIDTMNAAGEFNNLLAEEADAEYKQRFIDAGITVYEPSEEVLQAFRDRSAVFYTWGHEFGWSDGLHERVLEALGR